MKDWISQLYGSPQSVEELWLDDLYRYAPELWDKAVIRGHLTLVAEWEADGTSIILLLNGGGETVSLMADLKPGNRYRLSHWSIFPSVSSICSAPSVGEQNPTNFLVHRNSYPFLSLRSHRKDPNLYAELVRGRRDSIFRGGSSSAYRSY